MKILALLLFSSALLSCTGGNSKIQPPQDEPAKACGSIPDGQSETRIRYQAPEVAYNASCVSEEQSASCVNDKLGPFSGTFTALTCAPKAPLACGSTPHGQSAARIRYKTAQVAYNATCEFEEQKATCTDGELSAFSGTFAAESCRPQEPLACGATPHNGKVERIRYQSPNVDYGKTCESIQEIQTAVCINGVLQPFSGDFKAETCEARKPQDCGDIRHGDYAEKIFYEKAEVPFEGKCESQTSKALCYNGTLGPYSLVNYKFPSCRQADPLDCRDGNVTVRHGAKAQKVFFEKAEVAYNKECIGETHEALCTNGNLSDYKGLHDYKFTECRKLEKPECEPNETFTRTRYAASSASYPNKCSSKIQTVSCSNGKVVWPDLPGFTYDSCLEIGPLDCGEVKHGEFAERTYYSQASVPYGQNCDSVAQKQKAFCDNGKLGDWQGSAAFASCVTEAPKDCKADGLKHGESAPKNFYKSATVPWNATCEPHEQIGTCDNGQMKWNGKLTETSCKVTPPLACGTLEHGQTTQKTMYKTLSVAWNSTCESENRSQICENGDLKYTSGSFEFPECAPVPGRACGTVRHQEVLSETVYKVFQVEWNQSCSDQAVTRHATCIDGTLGEWDDRGSYFRYCTVKPPKDCTAEGIDHLESKTISGYSVAQVEWNQKCEDFAVSQVQTCENGAMKAPKDAPPIFKTCETKKPLNCDNLAHGQSVQRLRFSKAVVDSLWSCSNSGNFAVQSSTCSNGVMQDWSETPGFTAESCEGKPDDKAIVSMEGYTSVDRYRGDSYERGWFHLCTVNRSGKLNCAFWGDKDRQETEQPVLNGKVKQIKQAFVPTAAVLQPLVGNADLTKLLKFRQMMCALLEDSSVSCWAYDYRDLIKPIVIRSQRQTPHLVDFVTTNDSVCLAHADGPAECMGDAPLAAAFADKAIRSFQASNMLHMICGLDADKTLTCFDTQTQKIIPIQNVDSFTFADYDGLCYSSGLTLNCAGRTLEMPRTAARLRYVSRGLDVVAIDEQNRAIGVYHNMGDSLSKFEDDKSFFRAEAEPDYQDQNFIDVVSNDVTDKGVGSKRCSLRTDGKLRCSWDFYGDLIAEDRNFSHPQLVKYQKSFGDSNFGRPCVLTTDGLVDCIEVPPGGWLRSREPGVQTGGFITRFKNPQDIWNAESFLRCVVKQDGGIACVNDEDNKVFSLNIPGIAASFVHNTSYVSPCSYNEVPVMNKDGAIYCVSQKGKFKKVFTPGQSLKLGDCTLQADHKITCDHFKFPDTVKFTSHVASGYWTACAMDPSNRLYCRRDQSSDIMNFDAEPTNGQFSLAYSGNGVCYMTAVGDVVCRGFGNETRFPMLNGASDLLVFKADNSVCILRNGGVKCQLYNDGVSRP